MSPRCHARALALGSRALMAMTKGQAGVLNTCSSVDPNSRYCP